MYMIPLRETELLLEGLGPPAPQWATAAAVGPGAARTAMGHRRRRGAWGRPRGPGGHGLGEGGVEVLNVIKDKLLKYKEKTEMREIPQNPSLTCDLRCIFTFLPKT